MLAKEDGYTMSLRKCIRPGILASDDGSVAEVIAQTEIFDIV